MPVVQWGFESLKKIETPVVIPIASNNLQGNATDVGNLGNTPAEAIGISLPDTTHIYLRANATESRTVGAHYVIIGKAL